MDVVIPYRKSYNNGIELRYALRGIQQFISNVGTVYIVGDLPRFITNVINIPAGDIMLREYKARNIYEKLLIAISDKRVSDDFAMFNDDHFLLKEFTESFHYRGLLKESINGYHQHQSYRNTLVNTHQWLGGGLDFDVHGPIVYNKDSFLRSCTRPNWLIPWGYGIKSLYCNLNCKAGGFYPDLKIKVPMTERDIVKAIADREYFSFDDRAINQDMINILESLYPQKSKYESD